MPRPNILLAEDDPNLGYMLSEYIQMHNLNVKLVKDGVEALKEITNHDYDLCILDIMMPKMDGFSLAKQIKMFNKGIPIIFLTAKSLKIDKLKGFHLGADDYLVKPVEEEELLARIHAVLRRTADSEPPLGTNSCFSIGKYSFDFKNQTLILGNKKTRTLTIKEAEILRELCLKKGNILERKYVLKKFWGDNDYFNRKSMDVFIYKLRKYLSKDSSVKIKNIHGKGFVLEERE